MELGCDGQLYDIIATGETLSEESTSFIIGNLLEAVSVLHSHTILHRDIKPENIVLVHVINLLHRETSNCVISDGLFIRKKNCEALSAALPSISRLNSYRDRATMKRSTCGPSGYWHTNCTSALPPSTSVSRRTS
jgi:serine/threonine protein kinase